MTRNERCHARFAAVAEDVDWMLRWGERPDRIAERVGMSLDSLRKLYVRRGLKAPVGLRMDQAC